MEENAILRVKNLNLVFHTPYGKVHALDGIDIELRSGEILGLVGESGCGKTVTALAISSLLPHNAEIVSGEILLNGYNILSMEERKLKEIRQSTIATIFQDPMTFLNPLLTIETQLVEILESNREHFLVILKKELEGWQNNDQINKLLKKERLSKREFKILARKYALKMLGKVNLPEPERILRMFPFELSGGMRQRVMIAMALMRKPKIIIADEITTALDVTVQAQILNLLRELKREIDASIIIITHDLAVVAQLCDRVAIMYAGNIVEVAHVKDLFSKPLHPYTKALLDSIIRPDIDQRELKSIQGSVPELLDPPKGCRFHPRCPYAFDKCSRDKPKLVEIDTEHFVSCFLYG